MKCHQRVVRERDELESALDPLFSLPPGAGKSLDDCDVREVSFRDAKAFILRYEWLGTMPSGFRTAVGAYWRGHLGGVVVLGSPNPMQIAKSVFGGWRPESVMQVHRGAGAWWAHPHTASFLLARAAKVSASRGYRCMVAFSDPMAGEVGTVYQASNWLCCGMTAKRPDYVSASGKRLVGNFKVEEGMRRVERPRKWRYVCLLGSRGQRREALGRLAWPVVDYPKREVENA